LSWISFAAVKSAADAEPSQPKRILMIYLPSQQFLTLSAPQGLFNCCRGVCEGVLGVLLLTRHHLPEAAEGDRLEMAKDAKDLLDDFLELVVLCRCPAEFSNGRNAGCQETGVLPSPCIPNPSATSSFLATFLAIPDLATFLAILGLPAPSCAFLATFLAIPGLPAPGLPGLPVQQGLGPEPCFAQA
jgi:hypothetical protein